MANIDAPFGLKPIRHKNGAAYNGAAQPYSIKADYATALFIGDPCVINGTTNLADIGGYAAGTLPEVTKATAGDANAITGVVVGFGVDPDNLTKQYNPASNERIVWLADDPDLVFLIQDDGAAALAATSVGLNAVLIFTESGSTSTGLSGVELDTNSDAPAADASNQLTIRRLHNIPGNEIAANAVWEVTINNHTYGYGAVGI